MASFQDLCVSVGGANLVLFEHNIALFGGATAGPFGSEKVWDSDGAVGAYFQLPPAFITDNLDGKAGITIAAFIYPTTVSGSDRIMSFDIDTSSVGLFITRSSNGLSVNARSQAADGTQTAGQSSVFAAATWHFIAVAVDYANDAINTLVDSAYESDAVSFGASPCNLASPSEFYVGHDNSASEFAGAIAAIAAFDTVLSQANMESLAAADATLSSGGGGGGGGGGASVAGISAVSI